MTATDIRENVRERYAAAARAATEGEPCCGGAGSSCGPAFGCVRAQAGIATSIVSSTIRTG